MISQFIGDIPTLRKIIDYTKANKRFVYSRFGDGEIMCINQPLFANKRHQPTGPELSQELKSAFSVRHEDYLIGCVKKSKLADTTEIILQTIESYEHKVLYSATAWHEIFLKQPHLIKEFINILKDRTVIGVGGSALHDVKHIFNLSHTISTGDTNAYYDLDRALYPLQEVLKKDVIVIPAMGWGSNILARRIWQTGLNVQVIDIGSIIDALAGRKTRGWINKNWERIQECRKYLL